MLASNSRVNAFTRPASRVACYTDCCSGTQGLTVCSIGQLGSPLIPGPRLFPLASASCSLAEPGRRSRSGPFLSLGSLGTRYRRLGGIASSLRNLVRSLGSCSCSLMLEWGTRTFPAPVFSSTMHFLGPLTTALLAKTAAASVPTAMMSYFRTYAYLPRNSTSYIKI